MKAYKCKCDSCGEVFSSPEMYLSHRTCPVAAIAARDAVIRRLIDAGNAAIKGDYSDWDTIAPEALALIGGGEKGEVTI